MSATVPHWADVLQVRPEVRESNGAVGELQMSLHKVAYGSADVPYRKAAYYSDITQPTPGLIGFLGTVARRLSAHSEARALFHLDQGMGGGKSHALVGLFHMAARPTDFFATSLGQAVENEARHGGAETDLTGTKVVALTADHFSPGKRSDAFGPATTMFERFVWTLVDGDMDSYQRYVAMGPNKSTLQHALADAGAPVLVLLDELMDYVQQLADVTMVETMPGERAFLNALMDACDDVPRVAFVIVMIRSEADERGYNLAAQDFREYVAARLERNGRTVAVTEAQDFAAIIRRRLFEQTSDLPSIALARSYLADLDPAWKEVYDRLGANRGTLGLAGRVEEVYPFHPELMRVVREEWAQVQGFQRVRSTVAIFARTVMHWVGEHQAGRWAPALISTGDIPLTVALEEVLSSGLLLGNERAIQGYRAVASTDITSTDGSGGRAVGIDQTLLAAGVDAHQPAPAARMATALFIYSLVGRGQARRGATKGELLTAVHQNGVPFAAAEEVFNALTDDDEGLGALEVTSSVGSAPARYFLSIKQTLRMYYTAAVALIDPDERGELVWTTAQRLANKGSFDDVVYVDRPATDHTALSQVFAGVDSTSNRLVVLDPRHWTLLNGKDSASREDVRAMLGLGAAAVTVDNAASCVIACVNTQRRRAAYARAGEALAWQRVLRQLDDASDEIAETRGKVAEANRRLEVEVAKAFQHYAYLLRAGDELVVEFRRFDDDARSALRGGDVWSQLVADARASSAGNLRGTYLEALLASFERDLTPKEIVQAFYKNPMFPLVPSPDEIRNAMFELVTGRDWEFVDSSGAPLVVASAGQIQIASIQQTLRRRHSTGGTLPSSPESGATRTETTDTDPREGAQHTAGDPAEPLEPGQAAGVEYKRYRVMIANRSITTHDAREEVWKLLSELTKVVDPASESLRHQLISVDVTLTTADGDVRDLPERAAASRAKFTVEDDEF